MQRRRTFLLGLLVVAPAALSPALGQNAPPQVLAQSATAQAAANQARMATGYTATPPFSRIGFSRRSTRPRVAASIHESRVT